MFYRRNKAQVQDNVIDDMIGENNFMPAQGDLIAKHKIVRAIRPEIAESTHLIDTATAHSHRWAEGKLHALYYVRDQHAGSHFDRHAGCFEF